MELKKKLYLQKNKGGEMQRILNCLKDNDFNEVIVTETEIMDKLNCPNIELNNDVRSAGFYALGKAIKDNSNVILIVNGEYISNLYTSLTEAWFQKANILVIAYYESYKNVGTRYLERCTIKQETINIEEISEFDIKKLTYLNGPGLLNVFGLSFEKNVLDYGMIVDNISDIIKDKMDVFLYAGKIENKKNLNIKSIDRKYKYGVLSKYMGYVNAMKETAILCCTVDVFKVEMNIFNNRYKNENIKIIVFDEFNFIEKENINYWLENNDFHCSMYEKVSKDNLEKFIYSNKPEVRVIRKVELM